MTKIERLLLVLAALVVVVAGLRAASSVLVPILLAAFVAVIATPAFNWLRKKGLPSSLALVILILALVAAVVGLTALIGTSVTEFTRTLPVYQERLDAMSERLRAWTSAHGMDLPDRITSDIFSPKSAMSLAGKLVGVVSDLLSQSFLILLVVVFILLEAVILPAKVRALPGTTGSKLRSLDRMLTSIRQYMGIKTLMSLLTGVLIGIWLTVLGVDYFILLALLAFLLNYIPNIGSIIAAIPAVLLAVLQFGLFRAALVGAGYLVVNILVGSLLEPRIMGKGLGLSPLVILVALLFWGWVLGTVGMLLSTPLTMTLKIMLEGIEETRWLALLMGSEPSPAKGGS